MAAAWPPTMVLDDAPCFRPGIGRFAAADDDQPGYSWDMCCGAHFAKHGIGGNWKCWDFDAFTYERCCTFWPREKEDWLELPKHQEPFLWYGLGGGARLRLTQATGGSDRDEHRQAGGGVLWPGGAALARWADKHRHLWHGRKVLEIAAGVGAPSVVATHFGANVTATDTAWVAQRVLQLNLREAALAGRRENTQSSRSPKVGRLDIRDSAQVNRFKKVHGTFDIVLGSCFMAVHWDTRHTTPAAVVHCSSRAH
eukprot:TRINITY_DN38345_c0_g1_i6.p1 TRINITY_DN38345_c0_g1~~TRINITY_DN38345_c0_g1_i6.p1  ORF type:complete len:254 (-),score=45.26 TRINITY_DN38345_c0_g1_i6:135-896(-)